MKQNKYLALMKSPHAEALEGQMALRIASHLNRGAGALSHDISERLRFGREQALSQALRARQAAVAPLAPAVSWAGSSGRSVVLGGPPSVWLRLASLLPLVMLAAGLVLIQHDNYLQQIAVAAEIDSALLADDLPPAAYRDPGFGEFLRSAEAP